MQTVPIIDTKELLTLLADVGEGERHIVAIAGPPGSGKSSLAKKLEDGLNARMSGYAAILPMDGYHFDDHILVPRGLKSRKGAPETFDVDGFVHMLQRLRTNKAAETTVPVFDRTLEISRAGARVIARSVRLVIVEGNYLLLDRDGWADLRFDTTIMLTVPRVVLRQRLVDRWLQIGKSSQEINLQVDGNDMINVDLVQQYSRRSDFSIGAEY